MKNIGFRTALAGLLLTISQPLLADVTISEPSGGWNISADKAVNSTNGAAFSPLGTITISEGTNTDFAVGVNKTLILAPPSGWRFNPGVGTVTFTGSRDITSASIAVTSSNLTVTLSVGGTGRSDDLMIDNVQVQALNGADI